MASRIEGEKVTKTIELFALYGTPASIWKRLKEDYGEDAPSYEWVKRFRETYIKEIKEKRKELEKTVSLLNPAERWFYLQEIVDGALQGNEVHRRNGDVVYEVDRKSALVALKLADEWSQVRGAVKPDELAGDDLYMEIAKDFVKKLQALPENSEKSVEQIIREAKEESDLPETLSPYLEEIIENYQR